MDGSRDQDQGQTVKVGEQGSPLEETHFAGQYQGWPLPAGQGEPGVPWGPEFILSCLVVSESQAHAVWRDSLWTEYTPQSEYYILLPRDDGNPG